MRSAIHQSCHSNQLDALLSLLTMLNTSPDNTSVKKSETKLITSSSPHTDDYHGRDDFNKYYINYIGDVSDQMEIKKLEINEETMSRSNIQQNSCQLEVSQLTEEVV